MTNLPVIKEEDFKALIAQIPPKDTDSIDEVERILATSTIKRDDFGALRFLLKKYAGATGSASFEDTPVKAVTICCADHGVAKENVSAYPPETTLHMVANYLISHGAAANVFADFTGAHLCVADLGINSEKAKKNRASAALIVSHCGRSPVFLTFVRRQRRFPAASEGSRNSLPPARIQLIAKRIRHLRPVFRPLSGSRGAEQHLPGVET